jgi:hypothetical protein
MTNAECQMTKEVRNPNDEKSIRAEGSRFGHSSLGFLSSFGIRHSSFTPPSHDGMLGWH